MNASDGNFGDYFGGSASLSGTTAIVGSFTHDLSFFPFSNEGAAYVFRNLNTASGTITQNAKLVASDAGADDDFGWQTSISGNIGVISSRRDDIGANTNQGSAYVFRNLDTVTGTVNQNAKLVASDPQAFAQFGFSVAISNTTGIVGSQYADVGANVDQGAAYLFRNLHTVTGTVTENAKLISSDGAANDEFGFSSSISGTIGLVGARFDDIGANINQGSAYVFRNLDTVTGTVTQNAKLISSDGSSNDEFGFYTSISGNIGVVGSRYHDVGTNADQGAAYVYRNLNTVTGTVTQNAKLIASDGSANDQFGSGVSTSGTMAFVGAPGDTIGSNSQQGSAYFYRNLDTATGSVNESVKFFASNGSANDFFGTSVTLDGERFVIGAPGKNLATGTSYYGHLRTFTTANLGSDTTATDGLSFISRENWIIGQTTNNNNVTMTSGDTGNVTFGTNQVYVGQNSSSNNNNLHIENGATLTSNSINVGASGNSGNQLRANGTINLSSGSVLNVFDGNILSGAGTIQGTGSNVTISGSLRPGSGNLGSGIGTLTRNDGDVTWNGNASSPWVYDLGIAQATMALANTGGTRDLLNITAGNFNKGTGSGFVFDFNGTGAAGWYKLVDWTGTTNFSATDFTGINIHPSITSYQFFIDNGPGSTTALYIFMVPEPKISALIFTILGAFLVARSCYLRKFSKMG